MKKICPNPLPWHDLFARLTAHARMRTCIPPSPPKPLILAGWTYSNDVEKLRRWEETVAWARINGCDDILEISDQDFYCVDEPTSYTLGPLGGPMYRPWDFKAKDRPPPNLVIEHIETLKSRWQDIASPELSLITRPFMFTGTKARRLLVHANASAHPPWGGWSHLSAVESERRTFTNFRSSINKAIYPFEVDHVDFITDGHV
jgi:hypothetical protein